MTSWRRSLLLGLLVWLLPFVVAFAAFPLKSTNYPLFESIMPVVLAAVVVVCSLWYFQPIEHPSMREGLLLGVIWMTISVAFDLPLMLSPPMSYSVQNYVADVGLTYLMMPTITAGISKAAKPCERIRR
jgi:hypothetical protein